MKLAMEVPYAHLRLFASLTDFDFAIAPTVLEKGQKSIYVKWLQKQADKGREVWLDNGWFELKRSLSQDQLIKAAKMIHATHIVAPEVLNDSEQTLFHIMELKDYILRNDLNIKVVGSWQGFLKDLITLKTICNEVAMPRDRQRHRYVYNMKTEEEEVFSFFGPWESDPAKHCISYLSPFGNKLWKHKEGDEVSFEINERDYKYRVDKISAKEF